MVINASSAVQPHNFGHQSCLKLNQEWREQIQHSRGRQYQRKLEMKTTENPTVLSHIQNVLQEVNASNVYVVLRRF